MSGPCADLYATELLAREEFRRHAQRVRAFQVEDAMIHCYPWQQQQQR